MPARRMLPLLAAFVLLVLGAAPANGSTIVFQCGPAVCAVDPDAGEAPRQLVAEGRLAGLTSDGLTASWVDAAGTLVQAPVAGGAPRAVPYTGAVVNQPSMSPDGTRYLWWFPGPDGFGGLNGVWVRRLTVGQPETEGVGFCSFCVISHGWLGTTAIGAFPSDPQRGVPSRICRMASPAEAPEVTGSCVQVLATDTRGGIGFPSANAPGSEVVAVLTPGERTGIKGRIVRYSLASGGAIGDVTDGGTDTTPVFSVEGDRVAFERDGRIVVKDLAGGAERVVGDGVYPFWGGARPSAAGGSEAAALRVARTLRAGALRRGRGDVRVACAAACTVAASLRVSASTARRLGLGRMRTVAKAAGRRATAGTVRLRLRATAVARPRLTRLRSYAATVAVTITPRSGGAAARASARVRVRR